MYTLRAGLSSMFLIAIALPLAIAVSPSARSSSIVVGPQTTIEIDFTVPYPTPTISCCLGGPIIQYPPDLVDFEFSGIQVLSPLADSASLYNGQTLLGTYINSGQSPPALFVSPTSLFTTVGDPPSVIDFSSFLNGTIQGRLLITLTKGSFLYTDQSSVRGQLGLGSVNEGSFGDGGLVTITSVTFSPAPAAELAALLREVTGVGPGTSLADKATLAQTYYAAKDVQATCAVLSALIDEVRAQNGKKISQSLDAKIIADAEMIGAAMGCK